MQSLPAFPLVLVALNMHLRLSQHILFIHLGLRHSPFCTLSVIVWTKSLPQALLGVPVLSSLRSIESMWLFLLTYIARFFEESARYPLPSLLPLAMGVGEQTPDDEESSWREDVPFPT